MIAPIGERGTLRDDFTAFKHFSQSEVSAACEGGEWWRLDAGSLLALDTFAGYLVNGVRLIPSVAFMPTRTASGIPTATWNRPETNAHSADSWHYKGRAFDVMFPKSALATAWLTALRFPAWGGVGAYPFWHVGGRTEGGLHLDTRSVHAEEGGRGFKVLWWVDQDRTYRYLTTEQDIREFLTVLRDAT